MTRLKDERGQATVELAVVLPVVIIVAVIAVNALSFLGSCAAFDRAAHQAVCAFGSSPASGQGADTAAALVSDAIDEQVRAHNVAVSVTAREGAWGLTTFTARLEYRPTLFGLGLRSEVLGVPLPPLVHESAFVVQMYRPGVLF